MIQYSRHINQILRAYYNICVSRIELEQSKDEDVWIVIRDQLVNYGMTYIRFGGSDYWAKRILIDQRKWLDQLLGGH